MIALVFFAPSVKLGGTSVSIYWAAPLVGAAAFVVSGFISPAEIAAGLTSSGEVNPIKILVLFLSMTFMSVYLDELGFFRLLASRILSKAGVHQAALFVLLYASVSVLTVFTSNDIIILTFTPFICHFAKAAHIDPVPYLVTEFIAANTWSMALMIGNPTNIYLISGTGVSFWGYTAVMILPTLAAGVVSFIVLRRIFSHKLMDPLSPVPIEIGETDKPGIILGLIHLGGCIVALSIAQFIGVQMWLITLICFCSLVVCTLVMSAIRKKPPLMLPKALKRAPWELIPFVLSMFVLVLTLEKYGVTSAMLNVLAKPEQTGMKVVTFGVSSFLAANLLNNIPMSVLFSSVISGLSGTAGYTPALFAAVIGSNLGAFFTPIGALAGIMWMSQLKTHGVSFSFGRFVKYGAAAAIPTVLAALAVTAVAF